MEQKAEISPELFRSVPRHGFATGAIQGANQPPLIEFDAANEVCHRPHQTAITAFAFLQRLFGAFALANVIHDSQVGDNLVVGGENWSSGKLNVNPGTILPLATQIHI